MHLSIPHLAADVETERRRSIPANRPTGTSHSGPRRVAALVLARVSLASAAAVRRLDACIAEDLVHPRTIADGI